MLLEVKIKSRDLKENKNIFKSFGNVCSHIYRKEQSEID